MPDITDVRVRPDFRLHVCLFFEKLGLLHRLGYFSMIKPGSKLNLVNPGLFNKKENYSMQLGKEVVGRYHFFLDVALMMTDTYRYIYIHTVYCD